MAGPFGSPIITGFPAPPENPLSEGGTWTQTSPDNPPLRKDAPGSVVHSLADGRVNYSHYIANGIYIGPDRKGEVFACTLGGQLGAALETWRVALWIETGRLFSGYLAYYGGALSKDFVIRRYDDGSPTLLAGVGGGYPAGLALIIDGDAIQVWETPEPDPLPSDWNLVTQANDTTYRGFFYGGLGIEDPTSGTFSPSLSIGCFGLGFPNRQQFFRWLYN